MHSHRMRPPRVLLVMFAHDISAACRAAESDVWSSGKWSKGEGVGEAKESAKAMSRVTGLLGHARYVEANKRLVIKSSLGGGHVCWPHGSLATLGY